MARIVLETDVAADPAKIVAALTSRDGIAGWWTDDVELEGGVGATMRLGFPVAPKRFELTIDEASPQRVVWRSVGEFPPHWVDTTVTWTLTRAEGATKVHFNHDGWESDEGLLPHAAYTWALLLGTLDRYTKTGTAAPLFTRS